MDAFAQNRTHSQNKLTLSIDWDGWKEVGMAVNALTAEEEPTSFSEEFSPDSLEPVDHPLFDHYVKVSPDKEIYGTNFSPQNHWVLDEHRVMGQGTVPGTAFIEMTRAAVAPIAKGKDIFINEIYFVTPLLVPDETETEVRTVIEKKKDLTTGYSIKIQSRFPNYSNLQESGSIQKGWQIHAQGEVTFKEPENSENHNHDINAVKTRCTEIELPVAHTKDQQEESPIRFGPRWLGNLESVFAGDGEYLLCLKLPHQFESDLESFVLHPSLLDNALSFFTGESGHKGNYLPFGYKGTHIHAPLTPVIYSHMTPLENNEGKATIGFKVTIMNEAGECLIEIEEYSLRLFDMTSAPKSPEKQKRSLPQESPPNDPVKRLRKEYLDKTGMLTKEGIQLFARILDNKYAADMPEIIVSTYNLDTRIDEVNNSFSTDLTTLDEHRDTSPTLHPRPNISTSYKAPDNETEQILVEIWKPLIGIEKIGIHDDYFELGGDSLLATQVISRVKEILGVNISIATLFDKPTIAEIALVVDTLTWAVENATDSQEKNEIDNEQHTREEGEI
jgi:hypothetical protein